MAATAQRDARRAQVLTGVRTVIRQHGIGQATIARVAEAGGVSVGLVQHYYRSKEDLLIDAFSAVREDVLDRVDHQIVLAERSGARIEQMLVDGLAQLLPLSPRRKDEVYIAHAFAGLALEVEVMRDRLDAAQDELHRRVVQALENGKLCGEVDPDVDSPRAAFATLSLVDGLAARLLVDTDRGRSRWATDSLADAVATLCPGTCHHGVEIT